MLNQIYKKSPGCPDQGTFLTAQIGLPNFSSQNGTLPFFFYFATNLRNKKAGPTLSPMSVLYGWNQSSLYHLLRLSDSRQSPWWVFSLEVPLIITVIARKALFWNYSCQKATLYACSSIISPWSRWCLTNNSKALGKTLGNFRNRPTVYLLIYKTDKTDWRNKWWKQPLRWYLTMSMKTHLFY